MNEEEKQAINHLERFMDRIRLEKYPPEAEIALDTSIEDVLYLIDKQQKEIEELTEALEEWVNGERINDIKHISKDKIREKIKELSKTQAYKVGLEEYTIKILKELLED